MASLAGKCEAAPAEASEDEDATDDGKSDCDGEFPTMEAAIAGLAAAGWRRPCY